MLLYEERELQVLETDGEMENKSVRATGGTIWRRKAEDHYEFTWDGENVVGRIYTVSTREGDRYYLCTLLLHFAGSTSFGDIRTVDAGVYPTYREACFCRGFFRPPMQGGNVPCEMHSSHPFNHLQICLQWYWRIVKLLIQNRSLRTLAKHSSPTFKIGFGLSHCSLKRQWHYKIFSRRFKKRFQQCIDVPYHNLDFKLYRIIISHSLHCNSNKHLRNFDN